MAYRWHANSMRIAGEWYTVGFQVESRGFNLRGCVKRPRDTRVDGNLVSATPRRYTRFSDCRFATVTQILLWRSRMIHCCGADTTLTLIMILCCGVQLHMTFYIVVASARTVATVRYFTDDWLLWRTAWICPCFDPCFQLLLCAFQSFC